MPKLSFLMGNCSFKQIQWCILKVYFSFFQVAAKWFLIHFHLLKPHPLPSTPSPEAPTVASQLLNSPKTRYTEPALFTATDALWCYGHTCVCVCTEISILYFHFNLWNIYSPHQVKWGTTADFLTASAERLTVEMSLALCVYTWQTCCRVDVAYSGRVVGNDWTNELWTAKDVQHTESKENHHSLQKDTQVHICFAHRKALDFPFQCVLLEWNALRW